MNETFQANYEEGSFWPLTAAARARNLKFIDEEELKEYFAKLGKEVMRMCHFHILPSLPLLATTILCVVACCVTQVVRERRICLTCDLALLAAKATEQVYNNAAGVWGFDVLDSLDGVARFRRGTADRAQHQQREHYQSKHDAAERLDMLSENG